MPLPQKRRRAMRTTRRVKRRGAVRSNRAKASKINVNNQLYFFTRRYKGPTFTGAPAFAPLLSSTFFKLSDLPNVNDFVSLFDRYMITFAKISFYLKIDPSAQGASAATYPKLYLVRDYDDTATPTSIDKLREHSKCKVRVMNPNKPTTFTIRPSVLQIVNNLGGTQSFTPSWKQWLDIGEPIIPNPAVDVPHFGVKWAIDDLTNTNYKVDMECQLWFRCKDTR